MAPSHWPARVARLLVRLSAPLAPSDRRARWREEWLAEIDAAGIVTGRTVRGGVLRRSLGAPWDAILLRASRWSLAPLRFGWLTDVRDAARALRRAPLQAATIVVCLAVGSTLTVLVFGVINAMFGGRLPGIQDRGRLVRLMVEGTGDHRMRNPMVGDFRALPPAMPGLDGWGLEVGAKPFSFSAGGQGGIGTGAFVSASFFDLLGTEPVLGRLLNAGDDQPDAAPAAVISHDFWHRVFGGSPDAIGATLQVTTITFQVVGVAPPGFTGLSTGDIDEATSERRQVWMPLPQATRVGDGVVGRDANSGAVVARLSSGWTLAGADSVVRALAPRFNAARQAASSRPLDESRGGLVAAVHAAPFHLLFADADEPLANALMVAALAGIPLIILGIGCANVAGIQLARAIGRTHELAIRVSLGAERARIARLLAIETGLLAAVAAAVGWISARELLRLAAGVLPIAPVADGRLLAFTIALPLGVTLVAGFLPAWRATGFDIQSGLRHGARVGRAASPRLRRAIVAAQIGLSVALLVAAGALIRGLTDLPSAVGRAPDDVLVAEVRFWDLALGDAREREARRQVVERVRALPMVESVGLSPRSLFLSSGGDGVCWTGTSPTATYNQQHLVRVASPEFFDVLRLTMRQGRPLRAGDDRSVVVVNEAFARLLPDPAAAVGLPVSLPRGRGVTSLATIVGVVEDNYERFPSGRPSPRCYLTWTDTQAGGFTLYVRTTRADEVAPLIRGFLRDVDVRIAPVEIGTVAALMRDHYRVLYGMASWLGLASTVALGLAAVGLFGVIAYGAAQRTHEFGVRLALGARPADIGRALVHESVVVVSFGALGGVVLAAPITWFLSQGLASVRLADPVLFAGAIALLLSVSLAAAARPVRRVSRIDPVRALRAE